MRMGSGPDRPSARYPERTNAAECEGLAKSSAGTVATPPKWKLCLFSSPGRWILFAHSTSFEVPVDDGPHILVM